METNNTNRPAAYVIPANRPYLTREQSAADFARAYCVATWGAFGQNDMVAAVVKACTKGAKTRGEVKANMLKWMDRIDKLQRDAQAAGDRIAASATTDNEGSKS